MAPTPKKLKSRNQVKRAILNSDGISRKAIAEAAELDIRTASTYVDELLRLGLVYEGKATPDGKGRPEAKYYSNKDNCRYVGIHLIRNVLSSIVVDSEGKVIGSGCESLHLERETKTKTFKRILGIVEQSVGALPEGKRICGIGMAVSRWLKPPLSDFDLSSDLAGIVERESGIPAFVELPISALLYNQRRHFPARKDIMVVHPGIALELGVMKGGLVPEDSAAIERAFFHRVVEKDGAECYCGGRGCLGNYATRAGMDEIFRAESAKLGIETNDGLIAGLRKRLPAAQATADRIAPLIAKGIAGFAKENGIEAVEILFPEEGFADMVRRQVQELSGGRLAIHPKGVAVDVLTSAALMAMFNVCNNFIER